MVNSSFVVGYYDLRDLEGFPGPGHAGQARLDAGPAGKHFFQVTVKGVFEGLWSHHERRPVIL